MDSVFRASLIAVCGFLFAMTSGCNTLHGKASLPQRYPANSQQRTAAVFLVTNLPSNDRVTMSRADLLENIDLAFRARDNTPWGKDVPFDIFKHYVLPHRLVNEPFKPYRKQFHEQLMPLVRQSGSILEAAIRVNLWCARQVEYRPSSFWLTAPADMQKIGFGRCEELAVFFAAAARSVGIPVRGCWVPAWRHTDDNHVWVEIWDNGKWIPLEAGSTVVNPNDNWFLRPARSAPAVYSPVYGHIEGTPDEPVYRQGEGYTTLNLTKRYAETETFTVVVLGPNGLPLRDQQVYLWTYNSGMPSIVAKRPTDNKGIAHFQTGRGSYIASTGDGQTAIANRITTSEPAVLDLREKLPESWAWPLTHPSINAPLNRYPSPSAVLKQELSLLASQVKAERESAKSMALKNAQAVFAKTPEAPPGLFESIKQCWPSAPRLATEYSVLSANERKALTPLIQEMSAKDLPLISMKKLTRHCELMPDGFARPSSSNLPQRNIFYRKVANPRLHGEPLTPWTQQIFALGAALRKDTIQETVTNVISYLQELPTTKSTPFVSPLTLTQMLTSKTYGTDYDVATFGTAILRSLGIPAQVNDISGDIYYRDEKRWHPTSPNDGHTMESDTARLAKEAGVSQLTLLGKNGYFYYVNIDQGAQSTYLPQGELIAVKIEKVTPNTASSTFRRLSTPQTLKQ